MTNSALHPIYQRALDRFDEAIAAGQHQLDVTAAEAFRVGIITRLIRQRAWDAGFAMRMAPLPGDPNGARLSFTRDESAGKRTPGRAKSERRERIEAIKPGGFDSFDIYEDTADQIRGTVQAVARALGRKFTTSVIEGGGTLMVTRIDSLEQASEHMRQHTLAEINADRSKWPFGRLQVGESETMVGANVESARSMAAYHKRRYGREFAVERLAEGATITRVK